MSADQVNQEASKIFNYFKNPQDIYSQLDFDKLMELI